MDINEKIIEIRHARDKTAFVNYFLSDTGRLETLISTVDALPPYPYKEYGSWALVHIVKSKALNFNTYYPQFVDILFKTDDQSVLRNITNCIAQLNITDYRESEFIDLLIAFIQDSNSKVALQVYAMQVLIKFCKKYPELTSEITEVITLNEEGKSSAYHASKRHFLKRTK